MKLPCVFAFCGLIIFTNAARADGYKPTTVVQDLPGWKCMALAKAYGPDGINYPGAPVFAGPHAGDAQVGIGAGTILASDPSVQIGGREKILRPNGHVAWIAANELTEWRALSDPSAKCAPALLSNGRYGTRTPH